MEVNNPNPSTNRPSSSTDTGGGAVSTQVAKGPRRGHKRPHPSLLNGAPDSWVPAAAKLSCSICLQVFSQPQVTKCGHTFCNDCIVRHISNQSRCPICTARLTKDDLAPNFAMNELLESRKAKSIKLENQSSSLSNNGDARESLMTNIMSSFNLNDIEILMLALQRRKEVLTIECEEQKRNLIVDFLKEIQRIKLSEKKSLEQELDLINQDLQHAMTTQARAKTEEAAGSTLSSSVAESVGTGFNTQKLNSVDNDQFSLAAMKRRIYGHFTELSQIYLDTRNAQLFDSRSDAQVPSEVDSVSYESLDAFGETLTRISRYHRLKPLATLSYSADLLSNSNIVSSIEFDKDSELFAIAGVTRKIKLFEYATVIGSAVDIHCPSSELTCTAKISCVAWSNYYKNFLASSDYDGCVTLWDAGTSQNTRVFNEHEKRVWSVDWSNGDPRLLASGSDDSKVRLWSTNTERSVAVLEAKANVCCVKFCPQNTYNIAFGSADHCVHYYDFRHAREPLGVLQGHKKAVSYVKFASKDELVSASTDSQLKLWNLEDMSVVRSFKGHTNEKNFVGLATDGNYIACGSENNSLYVFYKALPKPLFSFKFDNHRSMLDRPRSDDSTEFVSAVAWKKGSPVVVAANSQGAIKILELV